MKLPAGSPRETGGTSETAGFEVRGFRNVEPRTSSRARRARRALEKLADFFSILLGDELL
jgi:hypothetical protein